MARVEESHKGHDIVFEEPEGEYRLHPRNKPASLLGGGVEEEEAQKPQLFIDGRPINVIQRSDGTYSSEGVFYATYPSLLELARASIDIHMPEAEAE